MAYNLSEEYVDLPPGFHPTMCTFTGDFVVLTDGDEIQRYGYFDDSWTYQDVGRVTSLDNDRLHDKLLFGKASGHVIVSDVNWSGNSSFKFYVLQKPVAVTAFISDRFAYVAHGRTVSKFRDFPTSGAIEKSVTLPSDEEDEPVTFMLQHEQGLICFAGPKLYQYNNDLIYMVRGGIPNNNAGTVLCAKLADGTENLLARAYVVYTTGILAMTDRYLTLNGIVYADPTWQAFPDDQRATSACFFGDYIAILSIDGTLTIRDTLAPYIHIPEIVYRLNPVPDIGILCGTVDDSGKFVLVTSNALVFYFVLREQEESSSSEESEESEPEEDRVGWESSIGRKRGRTDMSSDVITTMQLECEWLADPDNKEKERKYREARAKLSELDEGYFETQHGTFCPIAHEPLFKEVDVSKHEYRFATEEVVVLDCGHLYHKSSLQGWKNNNASWTCPICRQKLKRERALAQILFI